MSFRLNPFASAAAADVRSDRPCLRAAGRARAPARGVGRAAAPDDVQIVEIKGIRASYAISLGNKKGADAVVEVVTAEDIGKLPAKNVADTVQRLPGVNISSNSGGDGAFADANRVSIRGTAPSLTQTLINGHSVGIGRLVHRQPGRQRRRVGPQRQLRPAAGRDRRPGHGLQDLAGRPDRRRRHRLRRHRDALAAEPGQVADARRLDLARLQHVHAQDRPAGQRPGRLEERGEDAAA